MSIQHTGRTCTEVEAHVQQEEIKMIMEVDKLDYGPAIDAYIKEKNLQERTGG